jgi:hypothetical protein
MRVAWSKTMYVLVIEFDRTRGGETHREKRVWAISNRKVAEEEAERFTRLAQAGSTNFLKGGDKLTFQECRLYFSDTDDQQVAKEKVSAGEAKLLAHAFNPGLNNPEYWEEFLAQLDVLDAAPVK